MLLKEAKEYVQKLGYRVLTEDVAEKEYLETLREYILKKAEKENFTVDEEQMDAVIFKAFEQDMDLETAKEKVWLAVYVDKNAEPQEIE